MIDKVQHVLTYIYAEFMNPANDYLRAASLQDAYQIILLIHLGNHMQDNLDREELEKLYLI